MFNRLRSTGGRIDGVAGRHPSARGLPVAHGHGPALVDAHRGRGAAHPGGVVRGTAWVVPDGDEQPLRLGPGDVVIIRGPDHYVVADDPTTPPSVVIHPGQRCTTLHGEDLALSMDLGVRTWGNSEHGATALLTGTYEGHSEVSRRLLDALPRAVLVRAGRLGFAVGRPARG